MSVVKGEKTGSKVQKQFRGVMSELKKVHWPTRKEITAYTLVVLIAVFLIGMGIFFVDSIFVKVAEAILK